MIGQLMRKFFRSRDISRRVELDRAAERERELEQRLMRVQTQAFTRQPQKRDNPYDR